ncbi:hypothetical protein Tco_1493414 [Tanacetum coccineum]
MRRVKSRIRLCTHAKRQGRERDNRNVAWPEPTNGKEGMWRSGQKIYFAILANIAKGLRDVIGYEYGLSSSNRWAKSHVLWAEIGEIRSIGPELVQETTNKVILIKEKLKAARDCQKSYVGNMRKHLELKLYWMDANLHVHVEEIKVDKTLRFAEEPVEIIDREVKSLKRSRIPIVKSIGT